MWSQLRVDSDNTEKLADILDHHKHIGEWLFSKEVATESKKVHLQGWCHHDLKDNTFRKYMAEKYPDLNSNQKCFTQIKDLNVYKAYIIKNDAKGHLTYGEVYTSLSQEAYDDIMSSTSRFEITKGKRSGTKAGTTAKSFYDRVYEDLESRVIDDGKIMYNKIIPVYLSNNPKRLSHPLMMETVRALTNKLEKQYSHYDNRKLSLEIYERVKKDEILFSYNFSDI